MDNGQLTPNLATGERFSVPGFYCMETPSDHWVETLTGLGATGVEIVLAHVSEHPMQLHPLIPMIQVGETSAISGNYAADLDLLYDASNDAVFIAHQVLKKLISVPDGMLLSDFSQRANTDFQITRGHLGVST